MSRISLHVFLISLPFVGGASDNISIDRRCFKSLLVGIDSPCYVPDIALTQMPNIEVPRSFFGSKCCTNESIGCFDNSNSDSAWRCIPSLPECISEMNPDFYVLTPERGIKINQSIDYLDLKRDMHTLEMDASKRLFVVIHGFGRSWPQWWMEALVEALLDLDNNVMVIRWNKGPERPNFLFDYFQSAANVHSISGATAHLLKTLIEEGKVHLNRTVIIGYSLGAHVAGLIGKLVTHLPKIIALDPAGPLFTCQDKSIRLDSSDAEHVEILHTNAVGLINGGIGATQCMGHTDFFVNGGSSQPGCPRMSANFTLSQIIASNGSESTSFSNDEAFWCGHKRAMKLFIEMLRQKASPNSSCEYSAYPCNSSSDWLQAKCFRCPSAGCLEKFDLMSTSARGKLYFNTQLDDSNDGLLCGKTYLVSLMPSINVTGKIVLTFITRDNYTHAVTFQEHQETLISNRTNSRLVTTSSKIDDLAILKLEYDPVSHSTSNHEKEWQLLECHLINPHMIKINCLTRYDLKVLSLIKRSHVYLSPVVIR